MKKLLTILVAALLFLVLTGCGTGHDSVPVSGETATLDLPDVAEETQGVAGLPQPISSLMLAYH